MGVNIGTLPAGVARRVVSNDYVGYWVAKKLDRGYFAERSTAIGLERDGKIVAGVIYENYCFSSVFCHIAVDGRLNSRFLHSIFDYPFNVCGVSKIIVAIAEDNHKSQKLVENMGFEVEAVIEDALPSGKMYFYTMSKKDCRFLSDQYVKKCTEAATGT